MTTRTQAEIQTALTQVNISLAALSCMRRSGESATVLAKRDQQIADLEALHTQLTADQAATNDLKG